MAIQEKLTGRFHEKELLETYFNSNKSEFLAIYGRRRVGKTFLIRSFFKKKSCIFFNATGIHKGSLQQQITEFTKEIGHTFFAGTELKKKENWFESFELLTEVINNQISKNKKIILFFDEFPWMSTPRSKILQALEYYWNRFWSQDKRIKLIICGSSASWIIKNIVNNKGGLHNRLTYKMLLEPMNLAETKNMLDGMGVRLNNKHIAQIYMATGGIPYYLSHITPGLSATQIIDALAFSKNGILSNEFDNLFSSLFENAGIYIEIIRHIANNRYGISQEDLLQKIKTSSKGGTLLEKIKDLENTGFIAGFLPYKTKKKGIYYKIIDEYTLFYLYWIEPIKETLLKIGLRKGYWDNIMDSQTWSIWAGYAFEAICYKHLKQISAASQLNPTAIPSTWRHTSKKGSIDQGVQIDLLFDREDDAITIFEIKNTSLPFVIDKEYAAQLTKKLEIFKEITKSQKQLFLGFISANGLKKNMYSEELVNAVITLDDLFKTSE